MQICQKNGNMKSFQGEPVNKTVFIIFFQGDQLKIKVKKICEGWAWENLKEYTLKKIGTFRKLNLSNSYFTKKNVNL